MSAQPCKLTPQRRSTGNHAARVTAALALVAFLCAPAVALYATSAKGSGAPGQTDKVERGKYLVTIAGCNDCHTPLKMGPKGPEPDVSRRLSGHPQDLVMPAAPVSTEPWGWVGSSTLTAFSGPWGTDFAANLTPDKETGIGGWDEDLFVQTIRSGKIHTGTRPIMPPMPWQGISQMHDDDLKAVFAYLMSLPPIHNQVPQYIPPSGGGD